jgi:hypothetical protein
VAEIEKAARSFDIEPLLLDVRKVEDPSPRSPPRSGSEWTR